MPIDELQRKFDLERLCGDMRAWTEVIQRFRHKKIKPSPQECTDTFHGLCYALGAAASTRNISDPADFVNLMGGLTHDNTSRAIDTYNRLVVKVKLEVLAEWPGPVTTYTASPKGFVKETVPEQWPRPELPPTYIKKPDKVITDKPVKGRVWRAWQSLESVRKTTPALVEQHGESSLEVYDIAMENHKSEDWPIPSFDSWLRYIREYKKCSEGPREYRRTTGFPTDPRGNPSVT